MKILFQTRKTIYSVPGGDTVQILKTKEYLEKLGVNVDISVELTPNLSDYDIVHLYNIGRPQEIYAQVVNAEKHKKKIALSTIYVNYWEYEQKVRKTIISYLLKYTNRSFVESLKVIARAIKNKEVHKGVFNIIFGYDNLLKRIVRKTDVFLPNSESEILRLQNDLNIIINKEKIFIIPNAVDKRIFDKKTEIESELLKFKDCILCVARVEGLKNQMNLILAAKTLPYTFVIIGNPAPNHINYYNNLKKMASENVIFIDRLDQGLLKKYYSLAKVHVLPSWFETTGLSSLEAAVMRTNIVITKKGDTEEYFKKFAYYCEPDSVESIKNAIIKAYEEPFNEKFRDYILNNFTWDKTAEKTLEAYNYLLENK